LGITYDCILTQANFECYRLPGLSVLRAGKYSMLKSVTEFCPKFRQWVKISHSL